MSKRKVFAWNLSRKAILLYWRLVYDLNFAAKPNFSLQMNFKSHFPDEISNNNHFNNIWPANFMKSNNRKFIPKKEEENLTTNDGPH